MALTLHDLKQAVVPSGVAPRRIPAGIGRGVRLNMDLATSLQRYAGLYEREVYPTLRRFSEGIRTAIDIGAADGIYSLYFLRHTRAERIHAFEPGPTQQRELRANIALNAASEEAARIAIYDQILGAQHGVFVGGGEDATWTATMTLDDLVPIIRTPCVVKIDVDGGELDVLRGAERLAQLPGVRWIIETHSAQLERECGRWLQTRLYNVAIIDNAWWRRVIPDHRPIAHNRWLAAH